MRQTLFYIPHEWLGLPVFGYGWLGIFWAVASVALIIYLVRRQGFSADTRSYLPLLAIVGVVIVVVLPWVEVVTDGEKLGVPIRSYGVMLLLGVVCGVALAMVRARRMGVDPDLVISLTIWLFTTGIAGARLFFVIQYWEQFRYADGVARDWWQTAGAILNVAEGGLVVYGSLVAALITIIVFVRIKRLPGLALADLMAPSMALGLALGRLGCLLNGCCYGGLCMLPWAMTFPGPDPPYQPASPPYVHQRALGLFYGISVGNEGDDPEGEVVVRRIELEGEAASAGLEAAAAGLEVEDRIVAINGRPVETLREARDAFLQAAGPTITVRTAGGSLIAWEIRPSPPPDWSLKVHPTQIYAAINATLLCVFLAAYYPYRRRDGEVIALLLGFYAVARYVLEMIRDDEGGFLGTQLTVSQTVSLGMLVVSALLWAYILRRPHGTAWPSVAGETKISG